MAVEVARTSAQGQAMTSAEIEVSDPWVNTFSPPTSVQMINVGAAIVRATGAKIPATCQPAFCPGALLPCASCTCLIIMDSKVSLPAPFSATKRKLPFDSPYQQIPSLRRFSPPVPVLLIILSSTKELPPIPRRRRKSPHRDVPRWYPSLLRRRYGIAISCPSQITFNVFSCKPVSFLMADEVFNLARSSSSLPCELNVIITVTAS